MEELLSLPTPTSHLANLRHFYDTMETHIHGLEALGKSHESYGDILVPIILKKLPVDLKRNLAREHSNKEWTIDELHQAILKEVEILEAGQNISEISDPINTTPVLPTAAFRAGFRGKSLPPPNARCQSAKRDCVYGKGKHNPLECTVITDQKT